MSESTQSPLVRLVLFMVCLSVLGSVIAGVQYYAVDLPQQQNVQAPANYCLYTYGQCFTGSYGYRTITMCCYKDCCVTPADLE